MRKIAIWAFMSTAIVGPTALAQNPSDVNVIRFDDADEVTGGISGPFVEHLEGIRKGHRVSLLRVRSHFIPEMLKSVENL